MLHCYFEGRKKLFEGLAISKLETDWTACPVLHFDMSTAKHVDKETAGTSPLTYEQIYGKGEDEEHSNQRLQGLIQRACKQMGRQSEAEPGRNLCQAERELY